MGVNNKVRFGIFLINLGVNAFLRGGLDIAAPLKSVDCNLNDIVGSQADIRLAARSDNKSFVVNTATDIAPCSCDKPCLNQSFAGFDNQLFCS